jgi:hypothetical protein
VLLQCAESIESIAPTTKLELIAWADWAQVIGLGLELVGFLLVSYVMLPITKK